MIKKAAILLIKLYQKTLSLDHGILAAFFPGRVCRFWPSCSEYTIKAIKEYGVFKGIVLGFYRINRCNPWGKGGIDEVDQNTKKFISHGLLLILFYVFIISFMLLFFTK